MTGKFESEFHKKYVGGKGEVDISHFTLDILNLEGGGIEVMTVAEILKEYRNYVHDPEADFPQAVIDELRLQKKIL